MIKRSILLSLAGLTLVAACADNPIRPAETVLAPQGALKPQGPVKDDISNNLDASLDATAEIMPLNVGGANGTTQLAVTARNGDDNNGCNFQAAEVLVVAVSSSAPAVATVSPSSLTFGSCGDIKTLTITPVGQGTATITVAQTSNNTGGTFNFEPATFTVNVTAPAPANTAPSISVVGVTMGASYSKGSVPAATCNVTDAEDGNSSFAASLSAITGPDAAGGVGSQTASCSFTDAGGLTASGSVTYSITDPSPPTIGYTLSPTSPDGSNDWYKSDVTLTWTVTEGDSPSTLTKTDCDNQNITADQAETTYSCSATSSGGSAGPTNVKIKRDGTAPVTTATPSPANGFGWNNSSVSVHFAGTDATSGIASCDADVLLSSEGAGQSATGSCTDNAGNSDSKTASNINIDLTNPTVALVGGPAAGGTYYFGSVPSAPTCNASDGLSGLDGSCGVSGYSAAIGTHTVKASAQDKAGNTNEASATYTVLAWTLKGFYQPVDMNGVYNTVKGGSTVPLKFEVFAGATELVATSSIKSFTSAGVTCSGTAVTDDIEVTTTGGTSLRYDATDGQFIQNWQTPKSAGACYRVTMTAQDGSSLIAFFKLK